MAACVGPVLIVSESQARSTASTACSRIEPLPLQYKFVRPQVLGQKTTRQLGLAVCKGTSNANPRKTTQQSTIGSCTAHNIVVEYQQHRHLPGRRVVGPRSLRQNRARPHASADARSRHGRPAGRRRLLLRLVEPLAAVPGTTIRRHPLLLPADVLEPFGPGLLDRVHLEIHLAVLLVRNPSQEGAVARPVAPVRGARPGEGIWAPVDTCGGGTSTASRRAPGSERSIRVNAPRRRRRARAGRCDRRGWNGTPRTCRFNCQCSLHTQRSSPQPPQRCQSSRRWSPSLRPSSC